MMLTAIVMVGAYDGPSEAISWVQNACRMAACDLIDQLSVSPLIDRIILVTPTIRGLEINGPIEHIASEPGKVHVGRWLSKLTKRFDLDKIVYFGGGSAPLMPAESLDDLLNQIMDAERGIFTNNRYGSDWAAITPAAIVIEYQARLPLDNMLGWVLSTEAELPVVVQSPSAASRLDIDTPHDLLTLRLHPNTKPKLEKYLVGLPLDDATLSEVLTVLSQKASHVFLAGRLSPEAWQALNTVTQCWLRVLSEERGMVSSGRLARGEVFSILADYIERVGLNGFINMLIDQIQAAIIDNRVMLAHNGQWPSKSDRFASDLGLDDQISDPWLRDLTIAAFEAPIPILMGGHGLLSGNLFAFRDML
jgi:hypothetical protein